MISRTARERTGFPARPRSYPASHPVEQSGEGGAAENSDFVNALQASGRDHPLHGATAQSPGRYALSGARGRESVSVAFVGVSSCWTGYRSESRARRKSRDASVRPLRALTPVSVSSPNSARSPNSSGLSKPLHTSPRSPRQASVTPRGCSLASSSRQQACSLHSSWKSQNEIDARRSA